MQSYLSIRKIHSARGVHEQLWNSLVPANTVILSVGGVTILKYGLKWSFGRKYAIDQSVTYWIVHENMFIFSWYTDIEMAQVVEILPHDSQAPFILINQYHAWLVVTRQSSGPWWQCQSWYRHSSHGICRFCTALKRVHISVMVHVVFCVINWTNIIKLCYTGTNAHIYCKLGVSTADLTIMELST